MSEEINEAPVTPETVTEPVTEPTPETPAE